MTTKKLAAAVLICSDARGRFIPRDFICDDNNEIALDHCAAWGLNESNFKHWLAAAFPGVECYWDAWQWVLDNAEFKDDDGNIYRLHQDGDLWGLCFERMSEEEKSNFGFED